ncbi:MAG TPA: hypothetical protein VIG66_07010 [Noviherbaspirillum sp.]
MQRALQRDVQAASGPRALATIPEDEALERIPYTAAPLSGRITRSANDKDPLLRRPHTRASRFVPFIASHSTDRTMPSHLQQVPDEVHETLENVLDYGRRLAARVDKMGERSLVQLPTTNERPQRSLPMRILTTIPPFHTFKPKKISELIDKDPAYGVPKNSLLRKTGALLKKKNLPEAHTPLQQVLRERLEAARRAFPEGQEAMLAKAQQLLKAPDTNTGERHAARETISRLAPLRQAFEEAKAAWAAAQDPRKATPQDLREAHTGLLGHLAQQRTRYDQAEAHALQARAVLDDTMLPYAAAERAVETAQEELTRARKQFPRSAERQVADLRRQLAKPQLAQAEQDHLQQTLARLLPFEKAWRGAIERVQQASTRLEAQRAEREQRTSELEQALVTLQEAIKKLHSASAVVSMLDCSDNALATDLISQKLSFVRTQIEQYSAKLAQSDLSIKDEIETRKKALTDTREGMLIASKKLEASWNALVHHEALLFASMRQLQKLQQEFDALNEPQEEIGPAKEVDEFAAARQARIEELSAVIGETKDRIAVMAIELPAAQERVAADQEILEEWENDFDTSMTAFHDRLTAFFTNEPAIRQVLAELNLAADQITGKADDWKRRSEETRALEAQIHDRALQLQLAAPSGFSAAALASPAGQQIKASLASFAARLEPDDPEEERELPRLAKIEILSNAIATITDGDAERSARLLQDLMAHPSEHWVPLPQHLGGPVPATLAREQTAPSHAASSDDMRLLFHFMASVPRGTEVLDEASGGAGRKPMGREQLEALQAYWMADKAQLHESSEEVRAWLRDAQFVAAHEARNRKKEPPVFETSALPGDMIRAFRAVKKGLLSNAPGSDYDRINSALAKLGDQWRLAVQDQRHKLLSWLPKSPNVYADKSPLHPRALKLGMKQLEAQGVSTVRTQGHEAVIGAASALSARLADGFMSRRTGHENISDARLFDLTAKVVCDYIAGQRNGPAELAQKRTPMRRTAFHKCERSYQAKLGKQDFEQIRREVAAALAGVEAGAGAGQTRKLIKRNPHSAIQLPAPFAGMLKTDHFGRDVKISAPDVLRQIAQAMDVALPETGAVDALADMETKLAIAGQETLQSKQDVINFFAPFLAEMRLRDQFTLSQGGEFGGGIPLLPIAPPAPFVANASVNVYTRRKEESFQIKSPTYGVEFVFNSVSSRAHDVRIAGGLGISAGWLKLYLPMLSRKREYAKTETGFILVRTLRPKDERGVRKEQESRDEALDLLTKIVCWDHPDHGPSADEPPFSGPLDAILEHYPDCLVADGTKTARGWQTGTDLSFAGRFGFADKHLLAGVAATPLNVRTDNKSEVSKERSGYAHQTVLDRSDERRQRLSAGVMAGAIGTFFRKAVNGGDEVNETGMRDVAPPPGAMASRAGGGSSKAGAAIDSEGSANWRVMGAANLLDFSKELAYNMEKNGVTRFAIGDKTGGSMDRVYGSPKDLLAAIERNEEEFLLRFLDTIPVSPGAERDTPQNRMVARMQLDWFKKDLQAMKKDSSMQFNIKHEKQPKITGWDDAFNALEAIAGARGDAGKVRELQKGRRELAAYRSSWSFKNSVFRGKGKDSEDLGVDFGLRAKRTYSAETTRAKGAYPS